MKLIAALSMTIFTFNINVLAQNENEVVVFNPYTGYRFKGIIPPVEFQYNIKQFHRQPLTEQVTADVLFNENPSAIWLKTEMLFSNYFFSVDEKKFDAHFTTLLHKQLLEDSEFDMIHYVIGMAQLGAVAYIAYRHIREYGFLK